MNGTEAFELLVRLNPVTVIAQGDLGAQVETLRPVLPALPADRQTQRQLPRTRLLISLAVLLVGALLVAPAFGFHVPGLDFFHGEQAPPRVVHEFSQLGVGAPPGMDPNVIAGDTRKVETVRVSGSVQTLWVAPTRAGGLCYEWTDLGGGCDRHGTTPLGIGWSIGGGGADKISGHVSAAYVDHVEIRFADATTVTPEITWVSAPINAGFFRYVFSADQRRPGYEVRSVVAFDKDGNVVTEEAAPGTASKPVAPSPDALVSQKSVAFTATTARGDAVIWQAPTRYEGKCAWLEFEGKVVPIAPCQAKGYDWNEGLSTGFYPTVDGVLFFGTAADRYEQIDIVYQDGDVTQITPQNHVFVAAIPEQHFAAGHQVERIESRGVDGQVIPSATYTPQPTSRNGCSQFVPIQPGQRCEGN
jgi:hypothetical protein